MAGMAGPGTHAQDTGSHYACVALAISSGVFATFSTVAVAYPSRRAAQLGEKTGSWKQALIHVTYLALSGLSILLGILANGQGPVAIAFPVGVGTNLLTNMILQSSLGIAQYTKNMRVGIMVLAAAVMILPDSGPADLSPEVDVLTLLQTKLSLIFISSCVAANICGIYIILFKSLDNSSMLAAYAVVAGTGTVLSTSISKLIQKRLPTLVLMPLLVVYVLLGCLCLGISACANQYLEDPSTYVPIEAGMNLVLMFVAGLCIWGDWQRLHYPLNYAMVYVLIVLGTYLVASFDNLSNNTTSIAAEQVRFVKVYLTKSGGSAAAPARSRASTLPSTPSSQEELTGRQRSSTKEDVMSDNVLGLLDLWADASTDSAAAQTALKKCLARGLDRCVFGNEDIADLCVLLLQEEGRPGTFRTPALEAWMRQHVRSFATNWPARPAEPASSLSQRLLAV
eukprot:TRINITY_DN65615_c0_g1_i1.p1 TRINITY_DN65615_c0_g1~~TRINITY_DN65615_c0_g1_i1.p1  ORF type:complete len:453 (-),score=77.65 TRINITY_DN65615_c0_g1_i1:41-1399(-)